MPLPPDEQEPDPARGRTVEDLEAQEDEFNVPSEDTPLKTEPNEEGEEQPTEDGPVPGVA